MINKDILSRFTLLSVIIIKDYYLVGFDRELMSTINFESYLQVSSGITIIIIDYSYNILCIAIVN